MNKILKDLIVKSRTMAGFDAPYVPGWDCHGLPIELNVEREEGAPDKDRAPAEFRRACRAYAEKLIRSGKTSSGSILGDWDAPYITMAPAYQAAIVRALGKFVARGLVYKGKKPVYWCLRDRTALAEAEVEYETHTSPSIYVEFPLSPDDAGLLGERVPALAGRDVTTLIWTTTPWTIPSIWPSRSIRSSTTGRMRSPAPAPAGRDSRRGAGRDRGGESPFGAPRLVPR